MTDWSVKEIFVPATPKSAITEWAEDDRPREKLMKHGAEALSNAELLAILIGSGTPNESAVDLMKRLMQDCDNNLAVLSKRSIDQLMAYKGIGTAKAITITAACELGKRREQATLPKRDDLSSARALYDHLWPKMRDLDVEEAYVVLMNQGFKHIDTIRISHGGITETAVDVRVIMRHAIMANATIIALAHNHPSGNTRPSRDDDSLTKRVSDACHTMRIHMADHIIVTDGDYYSYAEEGKL